MLGFISYLYDKVLNWSTHHRAPYFLAGISFAESSFFPIPPDVMLMSMGLAIPRHAWRNALIATLFSVLGGVFGYLIGYYGMSIIEPHLMASSYALYVTKVMHWFETQGIWIVVLAGFTPFPYKIFTISAGLMQMAFWPFLIGSFIGRGLRFFMVSGILFYFGERIAPYLRRYINHIALCVAGIVVCMVLLTSCTERNGLAPVEEHRWHLFGHRAKSVVVKRGDTLYSIAFRYDLDYRQVAAYNRIRSPYTLRIGQVLRLTPGDAPVRRVRGSTIRQTVVPQVTQRPAQAIVTPQTLASRTGWYWPARGRVVTRFAPQTGQKGINIAGHRGDKIYAASSGVVAYAGSGLAGYGNLIIINHNNQFLTAYGHNAKNMVHEGQSVKVGQVIADMGMIERRYWGVHFEIRRSGQPVNPLNYLK